MEEKEQKLAEVGCDLMLQALDLLTDFEKKRKIKIDQRYMVGIWETTLPKSINMKEIKIGLDMFIAGYKCGRIATEEIQNVKKNKV